MFVDISDDDVYDALIPIVAMLVPTGTPILRGQQNRVPMPSVPFAMLTTNGTPRRIGTNADSIEPVLVQGVLTGFNAEAVADFEYSVQVDFFAPEAESWATGLELLWLDKIAWNSMPAGIKPLYSEGRMQLPLVGAETQWIQRWTMTLVLDYQPTLSLTTQAATAATVVPKPIDVFYPDTPPGFIFGESPFGTGGF
jgi:hypothetical protein